MNTVLLLFHVPYAEPISLIAAFINSAGLERRALIFLFLNICILNK